jgi:catechol 2,3-dioxygenase-like lactoylglutathione lyase family enzyme
MAIVGIERLVYGVDDLGDSARFFRDFGLRELQQASDRVDLGCVNGARVVLLPRGHMDLPKGGGIVGQGVQEVVWGVDTQSALGELRAQLANKVEVHWDGELLKFVTPFGVPMALRVWSPKPVICSPDSSNAPGRVERLNRPRRWRLGATPRLINHVVFAVPHYESAYQFMTDVLHFRLTDQQNGFGNYLRADGTNNHHNILLLNANAPLPGVDGNLRFHHANFGLEDLDEIMISVNKMIRNGWKPSDQGLGRHRVDSALFYYFECPAGGEAEYGADADYVDDNWVPREWINPLFAYAHFVHNLPPFLMSEPDWNFRYITGIKPKSAGH